ncbi:MAG: hypothetical protein ABIQ93_02805 [Saprospiraceae bacterium]
MTGPTAYLSCEGKILIWEIASGKVLDSIESVPVGSNKEGFSGKLLVNTQYIIANDGNAVRAEFDLDRLFTIGSTGIGIYEISTGKKLETILAPWQQFGNGLAVWKDVYGAIHVAVESGVGKIYHYVLQN